MCFTSKLKVTCLFQYYSAVWCFLRNGDVFAHQDTQPFLKLGVTKSLTDDAVVQVKSCQGNQFVLATKSGGIYLASLSDSGQSFQLRIVEVCPLFSM